MNSRAGVERYLAEGNRKKQCPDVLILYATETGTAREVAIRLALAIAGYQVLNTGERERKNPPLRAHVYSIEKYYNSLESVSSGARHFFNAPQEFTPVIATIFIVSTAGQGEPPLMMHRFWQTLLRRNCPHFCQDNELGSEFSFAVFGLGDSSYEKYNVMGKMLHNRLTQLGGKPLLNRGLGDDMESGGWGTSFLPWAVSLLNLLSDRSQLSYAPGARKDYHDTHSSGKSMALPLLRSVRYRICGKELAENALLNSCINLDKGNDLRHENDKSGHGEEQISSALSSISLCVEQNKRITTPEHFQDVRELSLRLLPFSCESGVQEAGGDIRWYPTDALAVSPPNPQRMVSQICEYLTLTSGTTVLDLIEKGFNPLNDVKVFIETLSERLYVAPSELEENFLNKWMALGELLSWCMDLYGSAPQLFLLAMRCANGPTHLCDESIEKLEELGGLNGVEDYVDYVLREHRSVVEVLEDFPNVRLPLDVFVSYALPIRPRLFSISSCFPGINQTFDTLHTALGAFQEDSPNNLRLNITFAVIKYTTPYKRHRMGHATSYLAALTPCNESTCACKLSHVANPESRKDDYKCCSAFLPRCSLRRGVLPETLSQDLTRPLILIGPGLGIAPCRSLYIERGRPGIDNAHDMFLYGCRFSSKDWLYKDEIECIINARFPKDASWDHSKRVSSLVAFSRDTPGYKRYVQHLISDPENRIHVAKFFTGKKDTGTVAPVPSDTPSYLPLGHHIVDLIIKRQAVVFISGNAKNMPRDVTNALTRVLYEYATDKNVGPLHALRTIEDARQYVHRMHLNGRYFVDAW